MVQAELSRFHPKWCFTWGSLLLRDCMILDGIIRHVLMIRHMHSSSVAKLGRGRLTRLELQRRFPQTHVRVFDMPSSPSQPIMRVAKPHQYMRQLNGSSASVHQAARLFGCKFPHPHVAVSRMTPFAFAASSARSGSASRLIPLHMCGVTRPAGYLTRVAIIAQACFIVSWTVRHLINILFRGFPDIRRSQGSCFPDHRKKTSGKPQLARASCSSYDYVEVYITPS